MDIGRSFKTQKLDVNPDALTPLEALSVLSALKKKL